MKTATPSMALVLLLLSVGILPVQAQSPPSSKEQAALDLESTSWSEIERQLTLWLTTNKDTSFEAYSKSAAFQKILRSGNELFWNAMIAESEHPVVAIAGFFCLAQSRPSETLSLGLKVIAESQIPMSPLYDPVHERMAQELEKLSRKNDTVAPAVLDRIMLQRRLPLRDLMFALTYVPSSGIVRWIRSESAKQATAGAFAVALQSVLEDDKSRLLLAAEAEALLDKLVICPGYPRLVYAEHAATNGESYLSVLHSVLTDESLTDDDVTPLIVRKKDYIGKHLKILKMDLSKGRTALLGKVLGREL